MLDRVVVGQLSSRRSEGCGGRSVVQLDEAEASLNRAGFGPSLARDAPRGGRWQSVLDSCGRNHPGQFAGRLPFDKFF